MPENETESADLNDYMLKQGIDLPQLADDVRGGLAKILPEMTFEEFLSLKETGLILRRMVKPEEFHMLLEKVRDVKNEYPLGTFCGSGLFFQEKETGAGVAFWLGDYSILMINAGQKIPDAKLDELYKILEPYIIRKSEVKN